MDFTLAQNVVLETLQRAVCQNPEFLKPSEEKLKEWEKVPGFNTILQNIFCNYEIDYNIRLLAMLCCKNGIDRYWRKSAPNAISEEEKASLRRGFLADFMEPVPHLAKQKAVIIAKIARYDCPHEWTELIPTLLEAIRSDNPQVQTCSILILRQVVKNLCSKRLAGGKRMFQDLSENIFSIIFDVYNTHTEIFFSEVNKNYVAARNSVENALIALRILDKLTVYGFKEPDKSEDVVKFITVSLERIRGSMMIRKLIIGDKSESSLNPLEKEFVVILEKFICKQLAIPLSLLETHPFAFLNFIEPSLKLAVSYAFSSEGHTYLFEKFLIQCFNMIKAIVLCSEYKLLPFFPPEEDDRPATRLAHEIKKSFFTDEMVMDICTKLITHYFLLTPADLELWDNDPEAFATDEAGESWKYSLRPCVETLFVTIFHEFRQVLSPLLVELVESNVGIVSPQDFDAILLKDAVYNAVGLAAFDMYDEVNFNDWFMVSLREEVAISGNDYRIIRRRVVWLLSRWTGVKFSSQLYPALYTAMIPLLGTQEDLVVRLQVAQTIKSVVNDFEFTIELFLEYLHPLFDALFQLLKDVQECDTKMRVLNVLYFIVERVGPAIEPHYENLLKYLPLLWNESEYHNMLRCSVIGTLVHLVKALGHIKVPMDIHDFILSIISFSTDTSHDSGFYLMEDGLELWLVVVQNIGQATPDVMQLFYKLPPLLVNNTEYLRPSLCIMQAYIVLAPEEFLKTHGETMIKTCTELLSDLQPDGVLAILKLFELCIKAHDQVAIPLLKPLLPTIFENLYREDDSQYTETNVIALTTLHFSIISRVLLSSKETFIEMIDKTCVNTMKTQDEVMSTLLDNWIKHVSYTTQIDRRKLMALALSSLLTANSNFVYDKFCGILLSVVEVLNDLIMIDLTGERIDSQVYFTIEDMFSDGECIETEHEIRKKNLELTDPVHCVLLESFFRFQLAELESKVGAEKFKQFVDTVDVETLDMVCHYVDIRGTGKDMTSGAGATNSDLIKLFKTQLGI